MAERAQRRLAAIVSADVVGYSRLMQVDEAGTHARLKARFQELVAPGIERYGGRVFKLMGDGLLAEFPSVVAASDWAVEVQEAIAGANADSPPEHRIEYRVGVNLGDVIVDGEDLYGDGVNLAARLQEIAESGGVCLSDDAYRQARGKVSAPFADGGEVSLKNMDAPVRVWHWAPAHTAAAAPVAGMPPLDIPDKPSVAVLPFDNLSGDPEQEYFADGITEDILTALSRFRSLFVIARNSSFTYKGKAVDIQKVGRELGVRYVLEGSIRKAGNRVRITAQLIETGKGSHVWADRYDGELDDIFALQDRISENVVGAIAPSIESAEIERVRRKPTESLDAYDLYLQALPYFYAMSRTDNEKAIALLRQALARDPSFPTPKYLLACCFTWGVAQGWFTRAEVGREAFELAEAAVREDRENADALAVLSRLTAFLEGRHGAAIEMAGQAVAFNPNSFLALSYSGWAHNYAGDPSTAIEHFKRALQLSPRDPMDFDAQAGLAIALLQMERDDEAVAAARRATQRNPNFATAWRILAAVLAQQGQSQAATVAVQRHLSIDPTFRVSAFEARPSYSAQARARYIEGLRKAGLPE